MEHSRKQKLLVIVALILGIASLSLGFAAFSVSLNISSSASVTPNSDTFKVRFSTSKDSLVEGAVVPSDNEHGLSVTNGVINNSANPTISGLAATFTAPGQSVNFSVYVRNDGEYTAYLNNINSVGYKVCEPGEGTTSTLVDSACAEINRFVLVEGLGQVDGQVIGYPLEPGESREITIRLEYSYMGQRADGPFSVTFPGVQLVFSTIDDPNWQFNENSGVRLESGTLTDAGSIVSIGNEKFYVIGQADGNVKLLAMYNLYVGHGVDEQLGTLVIEETGIQDERATAYRSGFPFYGAVYFSEAEGYADNYGYYLMELGANVVRSRLITDEDLSALGCKSASKSCLDAPEWVYTTSYYTSSYVDVDQEYVYVVYYDGDYRGAFASYDYYYGVRPVVEIPLSDFE